MAKSRKRTFTVPADETKSAKFSRLASARVVKALKAIRSLGALASKAYEFNGDQASAIHKYLADAVKECDARFDAVLAGGTASTPDLEIKI